MLPLLVWDFFFVCLYVTFLIVRKLLTTSVTPVFLASGFFSLMSGISAFSLAILQAGKENLHCGSFLEFLRKVLPSYQPSPGAEMKQRSVLRVVRTTHGSQQLTAECSCTGKRKTALEDPQESGSSPQPQREACSLERDSVLWKDVGSPQSREAEPQRPECQTLQKVTQLMRARIESLTD